MTSRIGPPAWSHPESWSCDEMIREEILAALEDESGAMRYPIPKLPVFHQELGSDAEQASLRGHRS